ncbi:Protein FAM91A1 [Vitis vinifera]|uniref:Protein FAM91A1 n=1 Tax=Vitis vinifera TaxID=29760 RepID=A0A438C3L9_VITVI|nr:Protein FAM91A1 [Vitis vinifera]
MSFSGLKSHAVTLYEAGKLGHASIADLCKDLSTLEGTKFEGELQEFANHVFSLRCVLECLHSGGVATDKGVEEACDNMGMVASTSDEATSLIADVMITDKSGDIGMNESELNIDDFAREHVRSNGDETFSTNLGEDGNCSSEDSKSEPNFQNDEKLISAEGSDVGKGTRRRKREYRVDILRCESLAALPSTTLDRLFLRDYDILVSMVPLPFSSVLPGPTGPIHFGPPSYSSMTPWMKLVLYSTVACGPLSVVLMKGQCLRLLPVPLAGCEKALIWSWDGSAIGGLGSKFEGNLVKGSILLHCLNSLLKYSAVLVQPLSRHDLDESGRIVTMDIPLPLKNCDGSIARLGKELGLSAEECLNLNSLLIDLANKIELWTVGYVRLLKLFKERESDHFLPDDEKYEWVPLKYQATGPAAKLLHQKEQLKDSSQQLMNYASGKWNPLLDPSSPIAGALSDHQRLKLANRQRSRTEVLSFDGSILRAEEMEASKAMEFGCVFVGEDLDSIPNKFVNFSNCVGMLVVGFEKEISSILGKLESIKGHGVKILGRKRILPSSSRFEREIGKLGARLITLVLLSLSGEGGGALGSQFSFCEVVVSLSVLVEGCFCWWFLSVFRSYALAPVYEAATRPVEESPAVGTIKVEPDDADSREVVLPGVCLLFDGSELHLFDIGACLQARPPVSLIAEASAASASSAIK